MVRYASQTANVFVGASGAVASNDYRCLIAAPSTTASAPTNFLLFPSPAIAADFYTFEVFTATTPITVSADYSTGYSNTVDASSNVPTVFNYHGIFLTILDTNVAAPSFNGNNLANCDIVVTLAASYTGAGFASFTDNSAAIGQFQNPTFATAYHLCFRCQFGYQLTFSLAATAATNPSFPSCVQMTNCASSTTVYGGLPRFLNSVFSCHSCSQLSGQSTFPSIWFETAATAGVWTGWSVRGVFSANGLTISKSSHGFRCASAPSAVTNSDTNAAATVAVSNCAAYGYITPIGTVSTAVPK